MSVPTIVEIRDQILGDIQAAETSTPLLPRGIIRTIATALAGALYLVYRYAEWSRRQIFTVTADGESLDRRAAEFGVVRKIASRWEGSASMTGPAGAQVPVGTLLAAGRNIYEVTATAAIGDAGTGALSLRSVERGAKQALDGGGKLKLVTPIGGVARDMTVTAVEVAPVDAETDVDFRARLLSRQRDRPVGGAFADFIAWAKEVPGIINARVARPRAGEVIVYPITSSGVPSAAKLQEVERYINDDRRYPFGRLCRVQAPTVVQFDISISNLSPSSVSLQNAITAAVTAHIKSRYPDQYGDERVSVKSITTTRLSEAAVKAGAQNAVFKIQIVGGANVSLQGYTLPVGEIARVRNVTYPTA